MAEEGLGGAGYNQEEQYFHKLNQELIDKKRKALDTERVEKQAQTQRTEHWMKCPKCGGQMQEIDLQGVKVDQCGECQGIYFDKGELELLVESREAPGVLGGLKRLFGK